MLVNAGHFTAPNHAQSNGVMADREHGAETRAKAQRK